MQNALTPSQVTPPIPYHYGLSFKFRISSSKLGLGANEVHWVCFLKYGSYQMEDP